MGGAEGRRGGVGWLRTGTEPIEQRGLQSEDMRFWFEQPDCAFEQPDGAFRVARGAALREHEVIVLRRAACLTHLATHRGGVEAVGDDLTQHGLECAGFHPQRADGMAAACNGEEIPGNAGAIRGKIVRPRPEGDDQRAPREPTRRTTRFGERSRSCCNRSPSHRW